MALPTSGALSLNAMHVEAGGSSGTSVSINDADIRGLISKSSGAQMSFNEWYGASAGLTVSNTPMYAANFISAVTASYQTGSIFSYGSNTYVTPATQSGWKQLGATLGTGSNAYISSLVVGVHWELNTSAALEAKPEYVLIAETSNTATNLSSTDPSNFSQVKFQLTDGNSNTSTWVYNRTALSFAALNTTSFFKPGYHIWTVASVGSGQVSQSGDTSGGSPLSWSVTFS